MGKAAIGSTKSWGWGVKCHSRAIHSTAPPKKGGKIGNQMPYEDEDGLVECGHGDESFCDECGGCLDCSNCYCDEEEEEIDESI